MKIRKLLAWALCLCLILGVFPAVSAETNPSCTAVLTGNTGAVVTCSAAPLSAEVDDNDLAIVEIRGNEVRVIAKEGAVGVARLTVQTSAGYEIFDIPIGYTTFVYDGGKLTVVPGSDSGYTVTGINAAGEEYIAGSTDYPLPVTTDVNGWTVYENTDVYKLHVAIAKTGGTFVFTGTASDASVSVKKAATAPAVILLAGLDMSSSFTAPITVKKESTSTVTITALGGFTNTLTDAAFNNADSYGDPATDGGDGTNAEYAESAVIKGKSYSRVTLNGAGTLNLVCSTKNALKVGEYGSLTIDGLTLNVTSAKNGISADNLMTINGGNITVTATSGDAIRSDPDAVDATAGCAGNIVINGGSFTLQSGSDGIQAAQDLTINGGDFNIRAGSGYNDSSFNKDTMSCKGLKASFSSDDSDTDDTDATNVLTVNGGTFTINTPDDAIHTDGSVVINGGEFAIQTGDDGVHGDVQADFGVQGAADCKIHLTVSTSYEGLEAKNVYIKSGCYSIAASDDGINAAGGSSSGSDPSPWNPGPGGGGNTGDYSLNISGGLVNVNCNGDGLDSNGALNITGGSSIVWAQAPNGDNSPLDSDGTMTVNGGMVFGGGTNPMNENPSTSTSQPYVKYGGSSGGGWGGPGGGSSGSTISSGRTVVVKNASSQVVFSIKAPKNINYAIYSDPTMTSSTNWSITSDTSTPTTTNFWSEHSYGSYVQTQAPSCTVPGVKTATCSACGGTVTEEIAPTGHSWSYVTIAPTVTEEGYDLYTCSVCGGQYRTNFVEPTGGGDPCVDGHTWDDGVVTTEPTCTEPGVTTYTCTVCGETTTASAPAALGHEFNDETGVCGRCGMEAWKASFVCSEGCSVTAYRTQDLSSGGAANAAYAFARSSDNGAIDVSGSGQVNFVVVPEEGYAIESVTVTPTANYKNLKLPSEIGTENAYRITKVAGDVTVTVTASQNVCQHEFDDDGVCIHCGLEAPKASFVCSEGCSVTAYPTQDLTTGGTEHAAFALARYSDTGEIAIDGTGQVNFVVVPEEGYEIVSVTAEPTANYKNLKLPSEIGTENAYRITKMSGHVTVTVTARSTTPQIEDGYYLIGPDGWTVDTIDPAKCFAVNPANANEYMLSTTLTAGDPIKVVHVANGAIDAWYPDGEGTEYIVDADHAGEKTIYFKTGYDQAWAEFGGYIWIDANPVNPDPVLDTNLTFYMSLITKIELYAKFTVRMRTVQDYESWYLEVSKLDGDGNVIETKRLGEGQEGEVTPVNNIAYLAEYRDVTAKELGVDVSVVLHAIDANGVEHYGPAVVFNYRDYIVGELLKEDNDDAVRKLCADILNYGAAAQAYFDYETEHLVNENLSIEAQAAMEQFASTGVAPANLVNGTNGPNVYSSVSVKNRIVLTLTIRGIGSPETVQIKIKEHDGGKVKEIIDTEKNGSVWQVQYSGLDAEDMRILYDFVPVADGEETGTPLTWSVEGYAREARLNPDATDAELNLFNALLHYVDAVKAAFPS